MCNTKRAYVYKDCHSNDKIILKLWQRFNYHKVYTEQINGIALSSNDDER